jgi:F-type H+-transporting ATPase subunit epsilon
MSKLTLEVITPEKVVLKEEVDEVLAPTEDGQIGILPHHVPLLTKLAHGELVIINNKTPQYFAVAGGFLEVQNNKVTVLADYAIKAQDIEVVKAEEAKKRAEKLMEEKVSEKDFAIAEAELRRSLLELKVANRRRHK